VLLAAGIGITPIMSMLRTLAEHRIHREDLLIYGVTHSKQHVFREALAGIARENPHIDIVTAYSRPLPQDQLGRDYQVEGRIHIDTIRRFVPTPQLPFYLCGPASFMHEIYTGLHSWGVLESNLHFEAFGPASIRKAKAVAESAPESTSHRVTFQKSAEAGNCDSPGDSILELADRLGVTIPSGCRAGSCGTCQTRILSGKTTYPENVSPAECEPGHVLSCVARPASDVVVDA
jgi:ferredoxin-NADP reductase